MVSLSGVCGGGLRGRSIALPPSRGNCWREFIAQIYGRDFAARPSGGCCLRFWFIILLYLHTAENILFAARNPKHPHIRKLSCRNRN
ncbi:hypothetical protein EIKCOROL_01316 [Eikenella corrodens ATCC 23834]|uniref:Uncharacterized protein n=1 Tax=Eikenella corrodens ATCC 23834 TaxID=546274 RepID=C0DVC7_EIKCO|nr:hypothetical protein EIKCOROL_01316 [Eikenella corrodens ATCC 23834]